MVGRRRTIDRDNVLDAAEAVVAAVGAPGLTIDAVARQAGITKGGVQYCFGSKSDLIAAMIARWEAEFDAEVAALVGDDPDPLTEIRAHVAVTGRLDAAASSRAAVMLAALIQTPEQLQRTRAWYRARLDMLDAGTEAGRRARLALLATEGAFLLRSFGFLDIAEEEWRATFRDILALTNTAES